MTANGKGSLEVAIVGGGPTGLALAVGLLKRKVDFTIYERADELGELGVAVGFTPSAERAMRKLDPSIHQGYLNVSTTEPGSSMLCVDSFREQGDDPHTSVENLLFDIRAKDRYGACRRCDFVDELVKLIPQRNVRLGKWLESVETEDASGRAVLSFRDGSKAKADVIIGCDGVRSRVRRSMFGSGPSSPGARYSHQVAYRGIVPLERAVAALGKGKTVRTTCHTGPTGILLSVPLTEVNMMHIDAFVIDPNEWPEHEAGTGNNRYVVPATVQEALDAYAGYGTTARTILSLLPEKLEKWAIFDMLDAPVPTYAQGCICLAGDSAHSSTPNHGGGAGLGIEDALVLAEVLGVVANRSGVDKSVISEALAVYSEVRYERSQWVVQSSRKLIKLFTWHGREYGTDVEAVGKEIMRRSGIVLNYDVDGMVNDTLHKLEKRLTLN